jgi:nitric-oxide synthase
MRSGFSAPREVAAATGAGAYCGACLTLIDDICGQPSWQPAAIQEAFDVAADIRTFRIVPRAGAIQPTRAGEFLPLGARIDGAWVDRNYTITASGENMPYYEITVKKTEGALARRLFRDDGEAPLLRIARPRGSFRLRDDETAPVLFFAGGIGITPALAFCRDLAGRRSHRVLHVDYSVSRMRDACYVREFGAIARDRPGVSFSLRCTDTAGRIGPAAVKGLLGRHPDAICYLCGPEPYIETLATILEDEGLPRDRIRIESFARRPRKWADLRGNGDLLDAGRSEPDRRRQAHARAYFTPVACGAGTAPDDTAEEARLFLRQYHYETDDVSGFEPRWRGVLERLEAGMPYESTTEELTFGCRVAWRNAAACIGRNFWSGLQVRDRRRVDTEEAVFGEITEHLRLAYDGGNIRTIATALSADFAFWGDQVCRYAGYRKSDGTIVGDPQSLEYTEQALALGWKGAAGTPFDVLPLIVQRRGSQPRLFELPPELAFQVEIEHPSHDWFASLGLRWFAIPLISYLNLSLGGSAYTLPFNGWYTGPEIGTRNLADPDRYDLLPAIAERMELDTRRSATLWKDRAVLELNTAVIHSFEKAGVKIMDHHGAAESFMRFDKAEKDAGREVFGCREMLLPALSPSASPIFRRDYRNVQLKPHLLPRQRPW